MRHTLNVPGVKYENIPAVNAYIKDYITQVETEMCGVTWRPWHEPQSWEPKAGYPTIGARNIMACIGNRHCILRQLQHLGAGPEDRAHHLPQPLPHQNQHRPAAPTTATRPTCSDFGIIGVAKHGPIIHDRCIGCGAVRATPASTRATRCAEPQRGYRQDRQGRLLLRGLRRVRQGLSQPRPGPASPRPSSTASSMGGRTGQPDPPHWARSSSTGPLKTWCWAC